jgi:hypothetical protein
MASFSLSIIGWPFCLLEGRAVIHRSLEHFQIDWVRFAIQPA